MYVGVYDEATSSLLGAGASMMLDSEDLLPGMKMTKAVVTQYYAKGAECEVTQFNEVYHSRDAPTMLRYDCCCMCAMGRCTVFSISLHL